MPAGAGPAAGRGDVGPGLEQGLEEPGPAGFQKHGLGSRGHQEPRFRMHPAALENLGGHGQVFQAAVGAGAQVGLGHGHPLHLADGLDAARVVRQGHLGFEPGEVHGKFRLVDRVPVRSESGRLQPALGQVGQGLAVGREKGELGPDFHAHVGHGHAAGQAEPVGHRPGELDGLVLGRVRAETAGDVQDEVLGHKARRHQAAHDELQGRRDHHPQLARGHNVAHLGLADSGAGRPKGPVGRAVGVGAQDKPAGLDKTPLAHDLVANARVPQEVPQAELLDHLPDEHVGVGHAHRGRGKVVVDHDHHPVRVGQGFQSQALEGQGAQGESLVRHQTVRPGGQVLTGLDPRQTGGPGQYFFRHRHAHGRASDTHSLREYRCSRAKTSGSRTRPVNSSKVAISDSISRVVPRSRSSIRTRRTALAAAKTEDRT